MTAPTEELDERAVRAVSSACAVTEAEADDAVDGTRAGLVARPTSTEQVVEVLRAGAAHGLTVVARGRRTKEAWALPPERADLVMDMSGMDKVLDHAAGDLIVEAQAGTRIADVQAAVADSRQRLALDEGVAGASVGGALNAASSGPSRLVFGTLRDLLIGVSVVRVDGVVAKAGGRVVKNVAGYDLGKLVHGSFGTLAVVTDAVFRLHPLPEATRYASVPVAGPEDALRLAQAVLHAQVVPGALEVDLPGEGPGTLTVMLEGIEAGVAGRVESTRQLLGTDATVSDRAPTGWATYPWLDAPAAGRATGLKATFGLSGLGDVLTAARRAPSPVQVRGSAGSGVVYAAVPAGTDAATVATCVDTIRAACVRRGGSLVVLEAPAEVRQAVDVWGPIPALDLMRRVKAQFDPDRRLAPGRFVGGI